MIYLNTLNDIDFHAYMKLYILLSKHFYIFFYLNKKVVIERKFPEAIQLCAACLSSLYMPHTAHIFYV